VSRWDGGLRDGGPVDSRTVKYVGRTTLRRRTSGSGAHGAVEQEPVGETLLPLQVA
jgi:hypothetical protein